MMAGRTISSRVRKGIRQYDACSFGTTPCHVFASGIYEKDAIRSVLPHRIPVIDEEHLTTFPYGYRNLAYGQSGIPNAPPIKLDLPQSEGEEHDRFYESFLHWLKGASIAEMKVELGV